MARLKTVKVQFCQNIEINNEYSFRVDRVVTDDGVSTTEFEVTEGHCDEVSDCWIGTADEIERFCKRDYEMKIVMPNVGF